MNSQRFELKEEHVKLLGAACVSWNIDSFGSPTINCKRPYGGSDIYGDMIKILGWECKVTDNSDGMIDDLNQLHNELKVALQIVISAQSFKPGFYDGTRYGRDWKYYGPNNTPKRKAE